MHSRIMAENFDLTKDGFNNNNNNISNKCTDVPQYRGMHGFFSFRIFFYFVRFHSRTYLTFTKGTKHYLVIHSLGGVTVSH